MSECLTSHLSKTHHLHPHLSLLIDGLLSGHILQALFGLEEDLLTLLALEFLHFLIRTWHLGWIVAANIAAFTSYLVSNVWVI